MAFLLKQVMPEAASLQAVDALTDEMGVDTDPPAGLVVHTHYEKDGRVHICDVWESEADYNTFREQRLRPLMAKFVPEGAPPPETTKISVHRMVRGC